MSNEAESAKEIEFLGSIQKVRFVTRRGGEEIDALRGKVVGRREEPRT
jgi:hypothetical protein